MIRIIILLILLTGTVQAETLIGVGASMDTHSKENMRKPVVSLKYEHDDWFFMGSYRDSYHIHNAKVKNHFIVAAGKNLFDYRFNDMGVMFDFGLAATSDISIANSSRVLFYAGIGFEVNDFRIMFNHTSNSKLALPNMGETTLMVEYRF